jgi:D-threo-aldose 1-dehydrogenase
LIYKNLGQTGLKVPPIIFGTSCLGNLYQALPESTKLETIKEMFRHVDPPVALDSAGKYGAGLALEVIGRSLGKLRIPSEKVVISNKLGWRRVPLQTPEPTFEPGVWADLAYDATQDISYDGILRCWQQGCQLLGEEYAPQLVSVHDPDEYLAQAASDGDRQKRWADIVGAYQALAELKRQGKVKAVGVGAKDWQIIRELAGDVALDWVMFANSLTIYSHPAELLGFMDELNRQGIAIINSAVFNAGFLTGGDYFNYRKLDPNAAPDRPLFQWREKFFNVCRQYEVLPANACVQFGMSPPGVISIALNTSKPERIQDNVASVTAAIPPEFWAALKTAGLIAPDYPYVG